MTDRRPGREHGYHPFDVPGLVRAGLRLDAERTRAVPPPATSLLAGALPRVDHIDAFAVDRRPGTPVDPQA
jgi:hypothetical protein